MKKKYLITFVDDAGCGPETTTAIFEANDRDEAELICLNQHAMCEGEDDDVDDYEYQDEYFISEVHELEKFLVV